jgi:DNA modification methylase
VNDEFRQRVIEKLRRGEHLPADWARELFPPDRREYELVYYGKEREEDILAETMALPLQPVSTFGHDDGGWHNMLIFGDNLQAMKTLLSMKKDGRLINPDGTPGVRLVYIDPPFATKQEFAGSQEQKAYRDKLVGAQFLEFIRKRLVLIRELLAPDGALFFHIDWKKGHYVKTILDELFGESRFRNEIVWWYYNKLQGNVHHFPSNHETIFYYTASDAYIFNPPFEEREAGQTRLLKRAWDSKTGKLVNVKDSKGHVVYIDTDERRVDDVWRLSMLQPADKTENFGYPKQKPETLLALIVAAASKPGDIVLDSFAGSGTTLAVAEKLGRRWIGVDCGKLAIYTIQKRMLSLRSEIGNTGKRLTPKPFTLYNAGLYDFSTLRQLPWADWRFFALQLFGCRDEPHSIGGLQLDGKLKGASVLVFNHLRHPAQRIDEETVRDIHLAVGKSVGAKFFIIAPRGVFDYQQDYIDLEGVRYYALRIPYSVINELHQREFTALHQPSDETAVNDTVDAVGFDFIRPPRVQWTASIKKRKGQLFEEACLRIRRFETRARIRGRDVVGGLETLSMIMLDFGYDGKVFSLDAVFFAQQLQEEHWRLWFPADRLGENLMAVFIDIYGNEAREVIRSDSFLPREPSAASAKMKASSRS